MTPKEAIYKMALLSIRKFCESAMLGSWRHTVSAIINAALDEGDAHDTK